MTKSHDDARRFVEQVAGYRGWALHPDPDFLDGIIEGLKENYNRYGYFLCPCRDGSGDRNEDRDIICPCTYCVPDQQEFGHCFCGLFLTRAFAESGRIPEPIPERRPPELQF